MSTIPVVVGIDAGGTATRARATRGTHVVYEGRGGAGNPRAVTTAALRVSYAMALAGCPEPTRIVACVAGAGATPMQLVVHDILQELYPASSISISPDYVAAFTALPPGTDVCVVAGTGSVVCSPGPDGRWLVSGGRGWILGDHGSAARLGQALLSWYVADPWAMPASTRTFVEEHFGRSDWQSVTAAIHQAAAPARMLAGAAPALTSLADDGHPVAVTLVDEQMSALAAAVRGHVHRHLAGRPARIGLVGGVWAARAAVASFVRALARYGDDLSIGPTTPVPDPLVGAMRLAQATS